MPHRSSRGVRPAERAASAEEIVPTGGKAIDAAKNMEHSRTTCWESCRSVAADSMDVLSQ